jgi:hypothetical protein
MPPSLVRSRTAMVALFWVNFQLTINRLIDQNVVSLIDPNDVHSFLRQDTPLRAYFRYPDLTPDFQGRKHSLDNFESLNAQKALQINFYIPLLGIMIIL